MEELQPRQSRTEFEQTVDVDVDPEAVAQIEAQVEQTVDADADVETVAQIEARYEKWLTKQKDKALRLGGGVIMAVSNVTSLFLVVKGMDALTEGNFEKALASVGALALLYGVTKWSRFAQEKMGSPELSKKIKDEDDKAEIRRMELDYGHDPTRTKKILREVRKEIMRREGDDYELRDTRNSLTEEERASWDRGTAREDERKMLDRLEEDPEAAQVFLRKLSRVITETK